MARALALVRFRDGSVYNACYNGTSDWLSPWLISDKKLKSQYNGSIFKFDSYVSDHYSEIYPDEIQIYDSEPVSIYIDYGSCFMWDGEASKSKLFMTSNLSYERNEVSHDIEVWVYEYFINHGYDTSCIEGKITDPLFHKERYKPGDYVYLVVTVDEILYHPGMFKTSAPSKPVAKKIIGVVYTDHGINYQLRGCHFNEDKIGSLVFDTYEDAVVGLQKRFEEGSKWTGLGNKW